MPDLRPSKIVAVGRNYVAHARELGHEIPTEPLIFLKPPTTVVGDGDSVVYPAASTNVHHEGELAVVMGQRCHAASIDEALSFVAGYTCANDVTARDLQEKDGQWTRAKGFDTFCPLGPEVVSDLDPGALVVVCRVNGAVRQEGNTSDMLFGVPQLVAYISGVMTLEPGDVILTGTPPGVGPVQRGDEMEVEIVGIGVLHNRVV
ncbi:MAG TPA: fumarylacetoacetate hydrolase family protein [Candidatus Dormibacteraeota bacterium]|jgi:2-keto-4-pentenoate hydratase/2-oxohepta-3-ene-1,7-dioic acid hydratase in catechol pathway|nr:fumarylacetoacetate hydrolase family protein [Candidatus Dormibacteraeota bacterium]